jgi:Flp pilus assembly pilin Flp
MREMFVLLCRSFWRDEDGASPLEIGAALLAAIAGGIWFIVLVDTMI